MSDLIYDKPQIIRIMREIMRRLRLKQVFVVDILDAMAQRDMPLTRARFDDMFLTRATRVTSRSDGVARLPLRFCRCRLDQR